MSTKYEEFKESPVTKKIETINKLFEEDPETLNEFILESTNGNTQLLEIVNESDNIFKLIVENNNRLSKFLKENKDDENLIGTLFPVKIANSNLIEAKQKTTDFMNDFVSVMENLENVKNKAEENV